MISPSLAAPTETESQPFRVVPVNSSPILDRLTQTLWFGNCFAQDNTKEWTRRREHTSIHFIVGRRVQNAESDKYRAGFRRNQVDQWFPPCWLVTIISFAGLGSPHGQTPRQCPKPYASSSTPSWINCPCRNADMVLGMNDCSFSLAFFHRDSSYRMQEGWIIGKTVPFELSGYVVWLHNGVPWTLKDHWRNRSSLIEFLVFLSEAKLGYTQLGNRQSNHKQDCVSYRILNRWVVHIF